MPNANIFWWIVAPVADAADLRTFFYKGNLVFNNGSVSLPETWNPDDPILCNCVFDNFILVYRNLCGKLFSSLEWPAAFDKSYFSSIFYSI